MSGLLTRAEVVTHLGCDPKTLNQLIRKKQVTLYKIGGEYERFNREEVLHLKQAGFKQSEKKENRFFGHVLDFWQYNNFYIVTSLVLVGAIYYFFFY